MEKRNFIVLGVGFILLVTIGLSGCVTEETTNKIIVGTSADFAPFEYIDENQTIVGFDIELITSILESKGYEVEVKDIAFDSLITELSTGKIDVVAAAMTITDEREEQIDFSNAYYEADQSVLINTDDNITIVNETSLANYTLGAQTGTTGASWVLETLVDTGLMVEDSLKRYETYTLAILDLKNGNIDAIILDKPVALAFEDDADYEVIYTIITNESYGFGVKDGETELLEDINQGLADIIDTAEWNALVMKYF
jgi:polar amino acid transport system substrate-binding protein